MTCCTSFISKIWSILADDDMKKLDISDTTQYSGAVLFPLTAARVMAFLALIQLGVSPWYLVEVSDTKRLPTKPAPGEEDPDAIVFAVDCIFICLKCLCDLECEPSLLSHVYSLIAVAMLEPGI